MHSCIICNYNPAIGTLRLTERTGYLVYRTSRVFSGNMCKDCAKKLIKKVQIHNIAVGWLGSISFILTPFTIVGNFYNYYTFVSHNNTDQPSVQPQLANPEYEQLLEKLTKIKHSKAGYHYKKQISSALINDSNLNAQTRDDLFAKLEHVYPSNTEAQQPL